MNRLVFFLLARCALASSNGADANSVYDQTEGGLTPEAFASQAENTSPDPFQPQEEASAIQPLLRQTALVQGNDAVTKEVPRALMGQSMMQPVVAQPMRKAGWTIIASSNQARPPRRPSQPRVKQGLSLSSVSAHNPAEDDEDGGGAGEDDDDTEEAVVSPLVPVGMDISVRPGAASAVPDVVTFGIFAKAFFGADLKHNKFVLDNIMALKWTDARVAALIPAGLEYKTMSQKQAMKEIWMPEIVITNRDIRKKEVISTVVTIRKSGEVTKIERSVVVCNNIYLLEQYPFDTQSMKLKIASAKYMLHELKLKPSEEKSESGVRDGIFDAFTYLMDGWKVYEFEEKDGAMQKSRGVLEIMAKRTIDKYAESHLMPTFLLLVISWGVFWFPFQQPFITPRLALSILALLSFTNLMLQSSSAIPDGAPCCWNDVFNSQIQSLMSCTILLNIITEIYKHHYKLDDLAQSINHEAKIVQPTLSIIVIALVLTGGAWKWFAIDTVRVLTKVLLAGAMLSYVGHSMGRMSVAKKEKELKEQSAKGDDELKKLEEQQKRLRRSSTGGGAAAAVACAGI